MTTEIELRHRYALVTGGSTGIGAAIARSLGQRGANLVLVARDRDRLEETASAIRAENAVQVRTVALDLAESGAVERLVTTLDEDGIELELLVNAAGISSRGFVAETDPAVLRRLVDLNVAALTELTAVMVARMTSRGRGAIVNIASTGAYTPAPILAAYAASKAYVLSFTQALWAETRATGVRVVAVSPGPTSTPMNPGAARRKRTPQQVARTVIAALNGSGPAVVDGRRKTIVSALVRLMPARLMTGLVMRMFSR